MIWPVFSSWLGLYLPVLALALWQSADAASSVMSGAANAGEAGAHFFSSGSDPLAWDTDELTHVRRMHGVNFNDEQKFTKAGNLAAYLGLTHVESIHMPVPLNVVLVGFAKDGNMHIDIPQNELQDWLGHVDHVLPHMRVERAELTCSEDGHCSGLVHGRYRPTPMQSFVHLNFTSQVVVVKKAAVIETFERAIHAFSRPVDPQHETGAHQVDAGKMEDFVDAFLKHLGLEKSYSLVVINPAWSSSQPQYGYRMGFSASEVEYLQSQPAKFNKFITAASRHMEPQVPTQPRPRATSWMRKPVTATKFQLVDEEWSSDFWVSEMASYLNQEEALRRDMLQLAGQEPGAAAMVQAARALNLQSRSTAAFILEEELAEDVHNGRSVHSRFRTMHPAEDCLVGNWVGQGRWTLLDLTAAGADWGPASGGEGVVNRHTLPAVQDYFSTLHDMKTGAREVIIDSEDEKQKLTGELSFDRAKRTGSALHHHSHLHQMEMQRLQRESMAPGAPEHVQDPDRDAALWERRYKEVIAQSELEVYEAFALRHCQNVAVPPAICGQIRDEVQRVRGKVAGMAGKTGTNFEVARSHGWQIFGDDPNWELQFKESTPQDAVLPSAESASLRQKNLRYEHLSGTLMYAKIADEAERARSLFMAELSAVLSRAVRHVIAPPSAAWRRSRHQAHDVATQYSDQVHFQIYVISDGNHKTWMDAPHTATSAFDLRAFQREVSRLKLDSQDFSFSTTNLVLLKEPALAVAFAASLKTAAHEIPYAEDNHQTVEDSEQVYLDAEELAYYLRQQFASHMSPARQPTASGPSARREHPQPGRTEVPIFVFQVNRDDAILIDEHYNARAMEDMVLVIHNGARHDEHPTGMMCGGALVARPLSPLRAALASTLMLLGGVLPPHLGYNPAQSRVTHDWLWSVGAHPLAFTSAGTRYSQLQIDALGRSYVLDGVDTSVERVNRGITALRSRTTAQLVPANTTGIWAFVQKAMAPPSKASGSRRDRDGSGAPPPPRAPRIPVAELTKIMELYASLVAQWRTIMEHSYLLEWSQATDCLLPLENDSIKFLELARQAAGHTVPTGGQEPTGAKRLTPVTQCMGGSKAVLDPRQLALDRVMLASLCMSGLALLYALWPAICVFRPKLN